MEFLKEGFDAIKGTIVEYGLLVIIAIVMLLVGLKVIKFIVKRVHRTMEKKGVDPTIVQFTESLLKIILKIALIIAMLSTVGFEVTSFVAVLGAAGFAVGMALQGTLSNFAAGVIILVLRPFKVGDFVELGGLTGTVNSITVFSTILKTPDNKTIIMPNGGIIGSNIINYSVEPQRRVDFTFGVDYSADIKTVKDVLYTVAKSHDKVLEDPDVFVGLAELGDSSVNFAVRVWVNAEDYWTVYFDIMEMMKNELDAKEIGIPYPHIQIVKE
jgi:small conductance mechanosensitive channel